MPDKYVARLSGQEAAASQTGTFYFEKPADFQFTAGQSIEITLPLSDVPESDRIHAFSICSAPYEDYVAITTRLRDTPFKRALALLTPNDTVEIEGPYGKFVVAQDTPRPIAFLCGGVGITPVFSIIKDAARDSGVAGFYLFYSNRTPAETPFLAQLDKLQSEHSEFRLIATMTAAQAWNGERERIGIEMIRRYIDPSSASFYTSGPPGMVMAMREMLAQNSVRREQVRFESFPGY
ncbi:MAG TPA: FAD-dependent oxidoreductase [Dehalococcoidia bacterium]|nr:FAD-dependent oxidoreductase [Dehalococcoidia bacterium]